MNKGAGTTNLIKPLIARQALLIFERVVGPLGDEVVPEVRISIREAIVKARVSVFNPW